MNEPLSLIPLGRMTAVVRNDHETTVCLPTLGVETSVVVRRVDLASLRARLFSRVWPINVPFNASNGEISILFLEHEFTAFVGLLNPKDAVERSGAA